MQVCFSMFVCCYCLPIMNTYLIYSSYGARTLPVGFVIGDVYRSDAMCNINPIANSIFLRSIKKDDCSHPNVTDLKKTNYTLFKLHDQLNVGCLMSFSGQQCYHFTSRTWLVLFSAPKVIADGQEQSLNDGKLWIVVKGDVRIVLDESACHVYLLRGSLYSNGRRLLQNTCNNFNLVCFRGAMRYAHFLILSSQNLFEVNQITPSAWTNMPFPGKKKNQLNFAKISKENTVNYELTYVGFVKKPGEKDDKEPMALITGVIHHAPFQPYQFFKSKSEFYMKLVSNGANSLSTHFDNCENLIVIRPKEDSITSIHSIAGYGFSIQKNSEVRLCGQLLVVDENDGSLISRLNGKFVVTQKRGFLRLYICDEDIILLDPKNGNYQLDAYANA